MFWYVQGIRTVFVSGTNGESLSMTVQERKDLLNAWVSVSVNVLQGELKVIMMVGAESYVDTVDLAGYTKSLSDENPGVIVGTAAMPRYNQ